MQNRKKTVCDISGTESSFAGMKKDYPFRKEYAKLESMEVDFLQDKGTYHG